MLRSAFRRIDWSLVWAFPLAAVAIHLIVVLASMNPRQGTAFARLAAELPVNTMTILPRIGPETQRLPYMSADARYAVCPFDTANGAIDVHVELPGFGWTVGVYTRNGENAYFAAAEAGRKLTTIDLAVISSDQRFQGLTPQAVGKVEVAPELTVEAKRGLIVARAPDAGAPYRAAIEQDLAKITCTPRKA